MVADIEELEEMDASELHARRLNAKEVLTPQRSGNFIFPVTDGTVRILGEQRLRTSTLTQDRPERGEEQEILQGNSDELHSPTPLEDDYSGEINEEAQDDFWTITGEFIYHHHVVPRVKLYVPRVFSDSVLCLGGISDRPVEAWENRIKWYFGNVLSQRSESNRWRADGVRVDNFARIHHVEDPRRDSKDDD